MSGASLFYRVTAASVVPLVLPSHFALRLPKRARSRKRPPPKTPPPPLPPTPPPPSQAKPGHTLRHNWNGERRCSWPTFRKGRVDFFLSHAEVAA